MWTVCKPWKAGVFEEQDRVDEFTISSSYSRLGGVRSGGDGAALFERLNSRQSFGTSCKRRADSDG